jgi:hypothetical protein
MQHGNRFKQLSDSAWLSRKAWLSRTRWDELERAKRLFSGVLLGERQRRNNR